MKLTESLALTLFQGLGSAKQARMGGASRRPSLPYKSFPF